MNQRDFRLSTRTRNCLQRERIQTVGELAQLKAADILAWQGAGKKTLDELRSLLSSVGLVFSGDAEPVMEAASPDVLQQLLVLPPREPARKAHSILLKQAPSELQRRLVAHVRDFPLSARAHAILKAAHITFVGDLVQMTPKGPGAYANTGKRTVAEFEALLNNQGLKLGIEIPDWSREDAVLLRSSFQGEFLKEARERSSQALTRLGGSPKYLDEELRRIAGALETGRNLELLIKLWGWNGEEPRTLESVGQELGLTRERVRQIEARAIERLKDYTFDAPHVRLALTEVRKRTPALHAQIPFFLKKSGIASNLFSVAALRKAAELLGLKWPFAAIPSGSESLIVIEGGELTAGE
jgi:hypothetical protein